MRRSTADRGEAGVVVLPLVLLAVFGLGLLALGIWRVAESSMVVTDAARAGARAYVEAPSGTDRTTAAGLATDAARSAARSGGFGTVSVSVEAGVRERCSTVAVTVSGEVPALRLPWVGELAPATVSSTHRQVVDPLRAGFDGEATCLDP